VANVLVTLSIQTSEGTITLTRTDSASIIFVGATVQVEPEDATKGVGEPSVATVTVMVDDGTGSNAGIIPGEAFSISISPTPDEVIDNCSTSGTDENGQCSLTIVSSSPGTYTLSGTISITFTIEGLDPFIISRTIGPARVTYISGKVSPTDTTCEAFIDGSAAVLGEVLYNLKDGLINSAAPGVFYYYSQVTAPEREFRIDLEQSSNPAFTPFEVQNKQQIRLYNTDCSTPKVRFETGFQDGQAWIDIFNAKPGEVFIVSVKYATGSVVGQPDPGEVTYSFATKILGEVLDKALNDLTLLSK
jgi:hypothetical protein